MVRKRTEWGDRVNVFIILMENIKGSRGESDSAMSKTHDPWGQDCGIGPELTKRGGSKRNDSRHAGHQGYTAALDGESS